MWTWESIVAIGTFLRGKRVHHLYPYRAGGLENSRCRRQRQRERRSAVLRIARLPVGLYSSRQCSAMVATQTSPWKLLPTRAKDAQTRRRQKRPLWITRAGGRS